VSIEVEYAQHIILLDAADIANEQIPELNDELFLRNGQPARLSGEVFRADPTRSVKGGLCLSIDALTAESLSEASVMILHKVGRRALRDALVRNKKQFVGLIIGEARAGRNYFDRFAEPGH
jgi:hypothetical protein